MSRDPTPEQIRERCAEIRKRWTPQERRARRVCKTRRPRSGIKTVHLPDNVSEDIRKDGYSWLCLTDYEHAQNQRSLRRKQDAEQIVEDLLLSESLEAEQFVPVPVSFGE